jgi:5-methylthioadenosine/S-adenosylhomocysteine deaminase
VLAPGHVGVREGRFVLVGGGDPPSTTSADRTVDARGATCHPGLIDLHAHVAWGLARCAVPEHFTEEEVFRLFDARMLELVSDDDEHLGTALSCVEMAMNGTTCFADTGSALRDLAPTAEAVEQVGIRGMISILLGDALEETPALCRPLDECLELAAEGIEKYPKGDRLAWGCVGLVGMETSTDSLVQEAKRLADETGVPLNLHKSFSGAEVRACRSRLGGRDPLEGYHNLGVLDRNLTLVHMNCCSALEADLIASEGASVVHCPIASMMYAVGGSRRGRFPELLERRVPVALGTDSTHWCNAWDLTRSMYLAATLHKEATERRPSVSAETALEMATIHGAQAVGRADELGSIEPGKRADIVLHDATRPEAHPPVDPVANLVFSSQSRTVKTVVVNGEVVVEDGWPTRIDLERLLRQTDERARDLYGRLGYEVVSRWPVEVTS